MTEIDDDEALDEAARGVAASDDDDSGDPDAEVASEVTAIGDAAGVTQPDGLPLGGPDEIEQRDAHRWELDPRSADEPADAPAP